MKYYDSTKLCPELMPDKFSITMSSRRRSLLYRIGQKCRAHRHSLALTLRDVSEQTGYSVPNLSKFERGLLDSAIILCLYTSISRKEVKNDKRKAQL